MARYNSNVKKPIDAFPKCPSCLYEFWLKKRGIHVYCHYCGWDSLAAWVAAGGMDSEYRQTKMIAAMQMAGITPTLSLRLTPRSKRRPKNVCAETVSKNVVGAN